MDKKIVITIVVVIALIILAMWAISGPLQPSGASTVQNLPSMVGGC